MEKTNTATLTFGIDIDEVLRALVPNMVRLYNREFGNVMKVSDVKDFVVDNSFPLIMERAGMSASKWFFQVHGFELFRESEEIEGAIEALNILRKYGKIIIITYQKSLENKIDTLQWLSEHGFEYDGICFVKDKTVVVTDYLIDDNDWNFIGSNAAHGVLINAPYNLHKDIEDIWWQSHCSSMERAESLLSFAKGFEKTISCYESC